MKYKAIEEDLLKRIQRNQYSIGEQIESEAYLSKRYGASELTVNKALTNLAAKGYLKRVKGKGTYVTSVTGQEQIHPMKHLGLTERIRQQGKEPGSQLIEYKVIPAREVPAVMDELGLPEDELLHYFLRVRTADGIPAVLSHTYIPVREVPYIDINVLNSGSLWEFLGNKGFKGTERSGYRLKIVKADKTQAKLLKVPEGTPILLSHHSSALEGNLLNTCVDNYYVTDRLEYQFTTHTVID